VLGHAGRASYKRPLGEGRHRLVFRAKENLRWRVWMACVPQPNGAARPTLIELHYGIGGRGRHEPTKMLAKRAAMGLGTLHSDNPPDFHSRHVFHADAGVSARE